MRKSRHSMKMPVPTKRIFLKSSGAQHMRDGEPAYVEMVRWEDEPAEGVVRGQQLVTCCDCGLRHLHAYEIFRANSGRWWLVVRSYRVNDKGVRGKK